MRFSIPRGSECPCGSTKPTCQCCLTEYGLYKPAAPTRPPGEKTQGRKSGCYASGLEDCGGRLSREHYISESLLRHLNSDEGLRVWGLPWIDETLQFSYPPGAFASKVLCERHNAALSPLDDLATYLFESLNEGKAQGDERKLVYLLNGHDIERWLLKVLCGAACSKKVCSETRG